MPMVMVGISAMPWPQAEMNPYVRATHGRPWMFKMSNDKITNSKPKKLKVGKNPFSKAYHFQREVGQSGAKWEDGTTSEHCRARSGPADQEAGQRHCDSLGHSPNRLDNDEVTVGQVWRPVVPSKEESPIWNGFAGLWWRTPHVRCEIGHHVAKRVERAKWELK